MYRAGIAEMSACPNDRAHLTQDQLRNIDGPLKRIWSQTPVQCPKCAWKGTFESYWNHAVNERKVEVKKLEREHDIAESELLELERILSGQSIKVLFWNEDDHVHLTQDQLSMRNIDCRPKRVWATIPVQCPNCFWKGNFESYLSHAGSCFEVMRELKKQHAILTEKR
jgi:hypothetical protein